MQSRGFTILEISIVLTIIAMIVGGSMTLFSSSLQQRQREDTESKLKNIQKALLDFRRTNNRLPCPADVTLGLTDPNFGVEGATPGNCTDGGLATYTSDVRTGVPAGVPPPPTADFANIFTVTGNVTNNEVTVSGVSPAIGIVPGMAISGNGIPAGDSIVSVSGPSIKLAVPAMASAAAIALTIGSNVEGMVPTTALHLPADNAIDGWGHRIMYTVDTRFTALDVLTPYPAVITTTGTITANSPLITNVPSAMLASRMFVYGNGITSPDTVLTITSPTSITLSSPVATDAIAGTEPLIFSATPIPSTAILITDTTSRMTVKDQLGNAKTTQAAYVLVSFGPNGHGAFPRSGAALTSRNSSGSNNLNEQHNCDCNNATPYAANNTTIPQGFFFQEPPNQPLGKLGDRTYVFDDIVAYGTRSSLRGQTE